MDEQIIELARYRMDKAREELNVARLTLENGYFKASISSSYYSIFHAARALLVFKKMDSKKHSGIIALFNREYIKSGLFDEKTKDVLTKAFCIRVDSDYRDFYIAGKEDAAEQLANAEFFIKVIVDFIKNEYNAGL